MGEKTAVFLTLPAFWRHQPGVMVLSLSGSDVKGNRVRSAMQGQSLGCPRNCKRHVLHILAGTSGHWEPLLGRLVQDGLPQARKPAISRGCRREVLIGGCQQSDWTRGTPDVFGVVRVGLSLVATSFLPRGLFL